MATCVSTTASDKIFLPRIASQLLHPFKTNTGGSTILVTRIIQTREHVLKYLWCLMSGLHIEATPPKVAVSCSKVASVVSMLQIDKLVLFDLH